MIKVCILDYGLGNILSLKNALKFLGFNPVMYSENNKKSFDVVFIPGVGSFRKASELLNNKKILTFLNEINKESMIFGICIGMQMLVTEGYEHGKSPGLNFLDGDVTKIERNQNYLVPIVGNNQVVFDDKLFFLKDYNNEKFYFTHSYKVNLKNNENEVGYTKYFDIKYTSVLKKNRIFGTQFHPEKSGHIGLDFIKSVISNI